MFGVATNCVVCKFVSSQIFYNAEKQRVCADCIQKAHDTACANLQKLFDDLYVATQKNKNLEKQIAVFEAGAAEMNRALKEIRGEPI